MGRAVAVLLSDPVSWANVCACVCLCACSCAQTHVSECVCVWILCVTEYSSEAERACEHEA